MRILFTDDKGCKKLIKAISFEQVIEGDKKVTKISDGIRNYISTDLWSTYAFEKISKNILENGWGEIIDTYHFFYRKTSEDDSLGYL